MFLNTIMIKLFVELLGMFKYGWKYSKVISPFYLSFSYKSIEDVTVTILIWN